MKSVFTRTIWAFFTAFIFFATVAFSAAKVTLPERYFPVYNYQNDWLVYNAAYKNYVPYSQGVDEDSRSVSLYIDLVKNRRYALLLTAETESYLFIEGALQSRIDPGQWRELSIDSLIKVYRKDELLVTIYGSAGIDDKAALLCHRKNSADAATLTSTRPSFINIKPISFSPFGNFAVLALVLILILNAWIFNLNPLSFIRLINPIEFFNGDPREQISKINKPYSNTIIFFAIITAMWMSFLLLFFANNRVNLFSVNSMLSEKANTLMIFADFLIISTLFFVLTYVKYVCMLLAGNMLNLDKQVDVLFIKIIQSSYMFYGAFFLIIFGMSFNQMNWISDMRAYIVIPFLFFYIGRFIALYVVTKPPGALINLYLFSYLCVIEIIPLIVSMKFAL
ncbi:DUF4271 domain-containing protein [Dyadobacter sp.]|uniref:DUF4271 domain-containing protein n=1 Tax=Dyadobacter sp. TaxID=1914288 RepID=UPI003F72AD38